MVQPETTIDSWFPKVQKHTTFWWCDFDSSSAGLRNAYLLTFGIVTFLLEAKLNGGRKGRDLVSKVVKLNTPLTGAHP